MWHSRLFAYTLACLELDLLHGAKFDDMFKCKAMGKQVVAPSAASEDKEGPGLRSAQQASEAAMRAACANLLVLATMMLSCDQHQVRQRVIVAVSTPLEAWHSCQNKALRGCRDTKPWCLDQLSGGFGRTLSSTMGVLGDSLRLHSCGFTSYRDREHGLAWRRDHPGDAAERAEETEDDLANAMGSLAIGIVGAFAYRMAWFYRGWPMLSVLLLKDDARQSTLDLLMADRRRFQNLVAMPCPDDAKVAKRSCFHCLPVQQVCKWSDEEKGLCTDRVLAAVELKHSRAFCYQATGCWSGQGCII
jgi:hypothetical protein